MSVIELEREVAAPAVREVTERDVLHRAADLLEEFGWCQGDYGSCEDGHFCLYGAVGQAARELGVTNSLAEAERFVDPALERVLGGAGDHHGWNDAPGRTKAEVVARLRSAAEAA